MNLTKTVNKFNQSHSNLRLFLRIISYGCYHRKLFQLFGIKERTYDDELRQMRFFIPKQNIMESRRKRHTHITFRVNPYISQQNYLVNSFFLKTILPDSCLHSILLLQITAKATKPLSLTEIVNQLHDQLMYFEPAYDDIENTDIEQLIRRRVNELTEIGLLKKNYNGKKICYTLIPQVLNELSHEDTYYLITAINFYKNVGLLSAPGYLLTQNLLEIHPQESYKDSFFQFKNNSYIRILDDDIILGIITAINKKQILCIKRDKRPDITVAPIAIHTDYDYNRQYLIAEKIHYKKSSERVSLRIDKIVKVIVKKNIPHKKSSSKEHTQELRLRITYKNEQERTCREYALAPYNFQIVFEEDSAFICSISVSDPLKLYPWLWSIQPWAEILPGQDGLRERMKNDLQEILRKYSISIHR